MANYGGLSVDTQTTVTGSNVRVRLMPRTGSPLYSAQKGDEVRIVDKETNPTDEYYWYMIKNLTQSDMKNGWIRGDFLEGADAPNPDEGPEPDIESDVWEQVLRGEVMLKRGNDNDTAAVKKLQQYLKNIGYGSRNVGTISVDGIFGSITEKAVRSFQNEFVSLQKDGVVGRATAQSLQHAQTDIWFQVEDYYPLAPLYMAYDQYKWNEKSVIMRAISGEHGYPGNMSAGHTDARVGVAKVLMNRTDPQKHVNVAKPGDYSYKSVYLCQDYSSKNDSPACVLPRGCPEAMAQFEELADNLLGGVWPSGAPLVSRNHIYQKSGSKYEPDKYAYSGFCRYPASGSPYSFYYINAYSIE